MPNINQYPILNQQEARREVTIPFQKSCGGDELCNSFLSAKLEIASLSPVTTNANAYEIEIQDRQEIVLNVLVENTGEPAYAAVMALNIDPSFTYVGRSDNQTDINCQLETKGKGPAPEKVTMVKCNLGNPYNGQRVDELVFRVLPVISGNLGKQLLGTLNLLQLLPATSAAAGLHLTFSIRLLAPVVVVWMTIDH